MKMMNRNKEDDLKWSRLPPSVCRRINRPFCIHQRAESAKYSLTSHQMRMMWTILVTSTDFDLTFLFHVKLKFKVVQLCSLTQVPCSFIHQFNQNRPLYWFKSCEISPCTPISRFPCCVLLALSWNTNQQMKIQVQISWVGQSTIRQCYCTFKLDIHMTILHQSTVHKVQKSAKEQQLYYRVEKLLATINAISGIRVGKVTPG